MSYGGKNITIFGCKRLASEISEKQSAALKRIDTYNLDLLVQDEPINTTNNIIKDYKLKFIDAAFFNRRTVSSVIVAMPNSSYQQVVVKFVLMSVLKPKNCIGYLLNILLNLL